MKIGVDGGGKMDRADGGGSGGAGGGGGGGGEEAVEKLWKVCMGMEMEESWVGLASRRDGIELVETDMRFCLKSWIGEIDRGFSNSGLYEE